MLNIAVLPLAQKELAIAVQTHLNELKDKVSELDLGLIDLGHQVDMITETLRSLKTAINLQQMQTCQPAIAQAFAKILQNFDSTTQKLRRCNAVDWITKGIILEIIDLGEQMIDEYCSENLSNNDWDFLQKELFDQLQQHLLELLEQGLEQGLEQELPKQNLSQTESAFMLSIELDDDMETESFYDITGDPFHLDSPLEALHLFDELEQDATEQNGSAPEFVPMPEILADIFLAPGDKISGSDDETELQGVRWRDLNEGISSEIDLEAHEDTQLNDAWNQFNILDAWVDDSEIEQSILDQLEASFEVADDNATAELPDFMADNEIYDFLQDLDAQIDIQTGIQIDTQIDPQIEDQVKHQNLMNFETPDIDTAIEESPIYQKSQSFNSQNFDLLDLGDRHEVDHQALPPIFGDIEQRRDRSIHWQTDEISNSHSLNVSIPYTYLEKLGDLSEDLVIRKGAIAAYLNGIRGLSADLNHDLNNLSDLSDLNASNGQIPQKLKQNLVNLIAVLDHTEQQAELMQSDIRHLRQHLYQTLKCPLSSLMSKFPRMLHDLAWQNGKQVDLVVQGSDIGLEKSVAEAIARPLELLLRYCVQYDIETPTERQQQGKPSQGKVEVIAVQSDAVVEIKIRNDGRNFDNDVLDLSEHLFSDHLAKLCDDVQHRLQPVGGTIGVQDSQFILTLPNSLSLVRVVLITINRMCLAIPSKAILEVLPIANLDARSPQMMDTLTWRDRSMPIVKLDETLMLNCRPTSSKVAQWEYAGVRETKPMPAFLVMEYGGKLAALQVDSCWGDQDATLHRMEGDIALPLIFSGVVILGTNQAIALLNPAEIMQRSLGQEVTEFKEINSTSQDMPDADLTDATDAINNINSLSEFFGSVERSPATPQPTFTEPSPTKQIRVLIVESSANVRRYLAMTLAKCGFLTEQAQDSQKAIDFIKEKQQEGASIDVVITDLEMPQMDGFKLLSSMQADVNLQNLPVVVLTAHNNENDQKLALELGAKAFFSKPYREQELVETLRKLVI